MHNNSTIQNEYPNHLLTQLGNQICTICISTEILLSKLLYYLKWIWLQPILCSNRWWLLYIYFWSLPQQVWMVRQSRDPIFGMVLMVVLVDAACDPLHLVGQFVDTNRIVNNSELHLSLWWAIITHCSKYSKLPSHQHNDLQLSHNCIKKVSTLITY